MSKLVTLDKSELSELRAAMEAQLLQRQPHISKIKPNAYLPNYEDIQKDMASYLPGKATSVSKGRLRKLFYYTNEEVCDEKRLKEANFGRDFLDACYLYISNRKKDRNNYLSQALPSSATLHRKEYVNRLVYSGITVGLLCASLTLLLRPISGWDHYNSDHLNYHIPLIYLSQIGICGFCSYIIARISYGLRKTQQSFRLGAKIGWSIVLFICLIPMRQLAVRDGLMEHGVINKDSGIFGRPDFEMVATIGSLVTGFIFLIDLLARQDSFSIKESLLYAFKGMIICFFTFAGIYLLYLFIVVLGIVDQKDFFLSPHIFYVGFPHPERMLIGLPVWFLYIFCTITIVKNQQWKLSFSSYK